MLQPPIKYELTFDLLSSNLVRAIAREVGNLLNNFDILGTFHSRLMCQANTCLTDQVTLRPSPLTLELMALVRYWSSCFICVPCLKFVGFQFGRYDTFISTLIRMMTLTFELVSFIVHCPDLHMVLLLIYLIYLILCLCSFLCFFNFYVLSVLCVCVCFFCVALVF